MMFGDRGQLVDNIRNFCLFDLAAGKREVLKSFELHQSNAFRLADELILFQIEDDSAHHRTELHVHVIMVNTVIR